MNESTVKKYFVRTTINVNAIALADKSESALKGIMQELSPLFDELNHKYKGTMIFKIEPFTSSATELPE
jgi:hypothetical protein